MRLGCLLCKAVLLCSYLWCTDVRAQAQWVLSTGLLGYDVRLYQNSPAWELAKAVRYQHVGLIRRLLKASPALLNYHEPQFGQSLLMFSIGRHDYEAAKALLEAGTNPNQDYTLDGNTPLIEAARIWDTSKFVSLLLSYGANPNQESRSPANDLGPVTTPLAEAASSRLESVKMLLNKGANINYVTARGSNSALLGAFRADNLEILRYLVIDKQADYGITFGITVRGDTLHIAEMLRHMLYPLDSKRYRQKMEVVHYLEARGVDYRGVAIPAHYYQKYSKEFLDAY